MSEGPLSGIQSTKKKSTAELRLMFEDIQALLKEGYTHKQICEQLNAGGLSISYAYYRVVMTRLRSERKANTDAKLRSSSVDAESVGGQVGVLHESLRADSTAHEEKAVSKKFSWDPGAAVKWK